MSTIVCVGGHNDGRRVDDALYNNGIELPYYQRSSGAYDPFSPIGEFSKSESYRLERIGFFHEPRRGDSGPGEYQEVAFLVVDGMSAFDAVRALVANYKHKEQP